MPTRFALCILAAVWTAQAQAPADAAYRALRDAAPSETRRVENIELKRDAATITFTSGQITFLTPVMNRVMLGVFSGEGRLRLKPATPLQSAYLSKLTGKGEVDEAFDSAALYFTDQTYDEIRGRSQTAPLDARASGVVRDFRRRLRRDVENPKSLVDALFSGESASNLEAELLSELYTPAERGSFRLFLHGKKEADLRFLVVPRGALPMLPAAEEVAILDPDPGGEHDGVWYLSHRQEEVTGNTASSSEDHRVATAQHYQIDNTIANNTQLSAKATIQFSSNADGLRVVPFGLLPSLRVSAVTGDAGRALAWVQEPLKEDSAFYVILPEPVARGKTYQIQVAYEGNKVIRREGVGNFSVGARTSWYPSLNSFLDRAGYDLTFRVPKEYTLVSVGKLAKEWTERNFACTQWTSDAPLAVAGFNYGAFKKKQVFDKESGYNVEVYATPEVPEYLRGTDFTMTPSAMADKSLVDAQNSIRLFQHWFGKPPYGRIAITQQPEPLFGQSWPSLVYLPVTAFLDATQRYLLLNQIVGPLTDFIQIVTPHEVAHQWWGHMVGWASFHDQWLSEGFAEFSAGLFVEASKPSDTEKFWQSLREEITQKNEFGNAANDAGPIWLGLLLDTFKNPGAYNRLVYPKGAYILQMLRMLMRDDKTGDQDFMAMMQDYVATYQNRNASSEDFKSVVEKHMKPALDLEGNRRMDWFYRDWIYGAELPKYRLDYSFKPGDGGKVTFQGKVTQSGVSPDFRMRVPIYFDFDGRWVRAGTVGLAGNMTTPEIAVGLPKRPKRVSLNANHDVLAAEMVMKEN
jgi:hypothetical protein